MTDESDTQLLGRPDQQPRKKTGRPSIYSAEIAKRICEHIATGGYATNLKRFGLPDETTVCDWQNKIPEFAQAYARARERRAEVFADQIIEIADTCEDAAKGRLQVEARKWVASKLLPRVYGENQRVEVQHTLSETAARVLADLSARQRQQKREQAKLIDVTPVPSLTKGEDGKQDQPLTIDCTTIAPGDPQSAAPGVDPPSPATTGGGGCRSTPPRSARKPRKKLEK